MSRGTEEQKQRYIAPCLQGETITWQAFNERSSGSDFASIETQAIWDGAGYVINGEKNFITGRFDPDYLWTLAVTDPDMPRRENLGLIMVEATLPGITIKTLRLLAGSERMILFDNVHVPGDCLVGQAGQGYQIAQAILESERSGLPARHSQEGLPDEI